MLVVPDREQLPVAAARAGSPDAWNILFQRYQLPLYTYAFELVRDEQASLDIVQETFINAARHIRGLRDDAKFGSWLFGIAHQKCIQRWRKHARDEALRQEFAAAPPEVDDGPLDLLIQHEQEAEFMNLLMSPIRSFFLASFAKVSSNSSEGKRNGMFMTERASGAA